MSAHVVTPVEKDCVLNEIHLVRVQTSGAKTQSAATPANPADPLLALLGAIIVSLVLGVGAYLMLVYLL